MVNKCVVFGCNSGYGTSNEKVSAFEFPFKDPELLEKWMKFVNHRDWKLTRNSVICIKHFKEEFITRGKRNPLKKDMKPYPTIYTEKALKRPSSLQISAVPRKAAKVRIFQNDEIEEFKKQDIIHNFQDLSERNAPRGYQCEKNENFIIFYHIVSNQTTGFPQIEEAIKIDKNLNVQLQFCGCSVPLPQWFTKSKTAQLNSCSTLENFSSYLRSFKDKQNQLLVEMSNQQHYKATGRSPYSSQLIRLAMLV